MPQIVLRRQEPNSALEFVYSSEPVSADWHVVVDVCDAMFVPNSRERVVFVATEPPDVREYDPRVLKDYGGVLSAPFRYLRELPRLYPATGLLPWRVGIDLEFDGPIVNLDRSALVRVARPQEHTISVVTSEKAKTRTQVLRLKLLDYLTKKIPEMRVFGRDSITLNDKADVLLKSRFHLALENCMEEMFWTEKLSDPILMRNITFYSGQNSWQRDFIGGNAIIEIDLECHACAYRVIRQGLDQIDYGSVLHALDENKRRVMSQLNLHHVVERYIRRQFASYSRSARGPTTIPQHGSSVSAKFRRAGRNWKTAIARI